MRVPSPVEGSISVAQPSQAFPLSIVGPPEQKLDAKSSAQATVVAAAGMSSSSFMSETVSRKALDKVNFILLGYYPLLNKQFFLFFFLP